MSVRPKQIMTRIRGVLGLAGAGGLAVGIFGTVLNTAVSLYTTGTIGLQVFTRSTGWWLLGGFLGGGFGVLLTTLASHRSLDDIGLRRAALWGAASGAVMPLVLLSLLTGTLLPGRALLLLVGTCASLGGLLGSGLIAVAKRAPDDALSPGTEAHLLD